MKKFEKKENILGGKGICFFEHLLGKDELNGMCRLYAKITVPKGASFGYHVHQGDSEAYYILSGTGKYIAGKGDERVESIVGAGDVTFTPEGEGHSLENTGDADLEIIALVINSKQKAL